MENLSQILDMGGYAAFVWPAYAITLLVMSGLYISTRRNLKKNRALAEELKQSGTSSSKIQEDN